MNSKLIGKMFGDWQVVSTIYNIDNNHSSYKVRNIESGKEETISSSSMTRIIDGKITMNNFLAKRGYKPCLHKREKFYINEYERRKFEHWLIDQGMSHRDFQIKSTLSKQMLSGMLRGDLTVTENSRMCFAKGGYVL